MTSKKKICFLINKNFLQFGLANKIQTNKNYELYAVIDDDPNLKKFFEKQTIVKFQKTIFLNDFSSSEKPNIDYLKNIEKNYGVNLWETSYSDRLFYPKYNKFYKFSHDEILSIDEQACRLFEKVLDEVKPDFFITKQPAFHHLQLFYEMCRAKGVKVLMLNNSNFSDKSIIIEDISKLDDNSANLDNFQPADL